MLRTDLPEVWGEDDKAMKVNDEKIEGGDKYGWIWI